MVQKQQARELRETHRFRYTVRVILRAMHGANKTIEWNNPLTDVVQSAEWEKGGFDVDVLLTEMRIGMEQKKFSEAIEQYVVIIKANLHRDARRETLYLSDMNKEIWEDRVEGLLQREWRRFLSEPMEVLVECYG